MTALRFLGVTAQDLPLPIVGIAGGAGSGKNSVAAAVVESLGSSKAVTVALADPIKRAAMEWYGFQPDQLWGASDKRDSVSPWAPTRTARHVLQQLGTEFGRDMDPDTWIRLLIQTIIKLNATHEAYDPEEGLLYSLWLQKEPYPLVVVPDVRFDNEAEAIREAGGHIVHVARKGGRRNADHRSELGIDPVFIDTYIRNTGTLEDLSSSVIELLVKSYEPFAERHRAAA